jgi:hypothetical protein
LTLPTRVNKSRHFHSLIVISIDKSFENSFEITRICIEFMLVVLTLNFFLFEPQFVLGLRHVDKAVKLRDDWLYLGHA